MTDRLDDTDLKFQRSLVARQEHTQTALRAELDVWKGYLSLKHELKPGDSVQEDGSIVRVPPAETS